MFDRTGSVLLTAVTFEIGYVPRMVGGTLLGALADRIHPRGLLVGGFLVNATVAAALGALPMPLGASLSLLALASALAPVFNGASSRLVAERLTGDAYVLGRSLSSVSGAGAQLLGLALGGAALAGPGPQRVMLVAAACQLIAAMWVRLALPVPLPVVALALMLVGAAFAYSLGVQKPFVAALEPDLRGQAFSLLATGLMTLQDVGPLAFGAVAQWLSSGVAMAVAGAGTVLVGLWWFGRTRLTRPVVSPSTATLGS